MPDHRKPDFALGASTALRMTREHRARYVVLTAANWAQNCERIIPEVATIGFPNRDGKHRPLTGDRRTDLSYVALDAAGDVLEFTPSHGSLIQFLDSMNPRSISSTAVENVTEYIDRRYDGIAPLDEILAEGKRLLEGWPAFKTDDVDAVIDILDAIAADDEEY